jgi:hypothetical protein
MFRIGVFEKYYIKEFKKTFGYKYKYYFKCLNEKNLMIKINRKNVFFSKKVIFKIIKYKKVLILNISLLDTVVLIIKKIFRIIFLFRKIYIDYSREKQKIYQKLILNENIFNI